ncbi:MAG: substrate-binding domain-containing protein [Muribaculaceae bacterium]|nr:substrate-binding domain-containing protein [Muribaculaceae bacterium]
MCIIITALLFFTGCKDEKVYKIGVSQCSSDDWRKKMNDEIERELLLHKNAVVEIRSAEDDSQHQIDDIRYFVENDFDIIICAPNEANALTPVIRDEVYGKGIPVVIFDRSINGDSFTAFQGADNHSIGVMAAEYADNLIDGECRIMEIYGLDGSTPALERHRGFVEVVDARKQMTIVAADYGNWNERDAARVAEQMLKQHPEVNLIYAHNDRMAIAAADVASKAGRDDIKIVGVDAAPQIGLKAVADSVIDVTFIYPTDGYTLVRTALNILEGRDYERISLLPTYPVDLNNAETLLLQNKEIEEETEKINWLKAQVDDYWDKHSAQTTLLYAAILILLLLSLLIFGLLRQFWIRKLHQEKLSGKNRQLEEQRDRLINLNEQLQEATQSKLMFFTNVSHDLRTPLTLIAGPVEQLAGAPNLTDEQQTLMALANKNIHILKRLINQILDFRKFENGKLTLSLTEVNLSALLGDWCESFKHVAVRRDIKFTLNLPESDSLQCAVDVEKIERVMFNLISNALKYTQSNGSITVAAGREGENIVITVDDTGQGISAEDLSHIFERFFQVDKVHPNGSGIGLSLAKAFVELHGGTLTAESEEGKGSVFKVVLPVKHIDSVSAEVSGNITAKDVNMEMGELTVELTESDRDKTTALVIDDNPDILTLVKSVLKDDYTVLTAPDGSLGLKMAMKYVPDIIICDVMMPGIDGLECCRRLKTEQSTSHIPVLMLTACTMDEQRIQGYECGADAYLSKPFNTDVLKVRCRSLIENRRRIKSLMPGMALSESKDEAGHSAPRSTDMDSDFYSRFVALVEKEMSNPDLSVDGVAARMGLGRTQFYRKIKALTNYSPVELLRNLRLAKARNLLTTTDKSVSEIAYEVGFSSPAYFGKCFKDRYNETPGDVRDSLKK